MIIDSHAYCFEPGDSLPGYSSVAEHLAWVQMGQAGHYQPAFRLRDRKPGSSDVLAPAGTGLSTLPDVDLRIDHAAGRVVWTVDGEENLPEGPYVLLHNESSLVDVLMIHGLLLTEVSDAHNLGNIGLRHTEVDLKELYDRAVKLVAV